jgi:hypothetical protein
MAKACSPPNNAHRVFHNESNPMQKSLKHSFKRTLAAAGVLAAFAGGAQAASWSTLTNAAPGGTGVMMLLTDGTVMVKTGNANWSRLSPSATGSYVNGTYSALAPMSTGRLYFASNVMQDGRVFVLGGEYSGATMSANWTNTGEIYDPVSNSWTPIAHHPESQYGDVPSMLLPDGRIFTGSLSSSKSYIYTPSTNTWAQSGSKVYADQSDEETWVRIPDGRILTYDLFHSYQTGGAYAEAYNPATGTWASLSPSDGSAAGSIPQLSSSALGAEMGPGLLMRRASTGGDVLFVGATGHTGIYSIGTNTWAAGPEVQGVVNGKTEQFGADDAPGAEMPSGHILFAADAGPSGGTFTGPTQLFDFDPASRTVAPVSPAFPTPSALSGSAFTMTMLVLPTGQILVSNGSTKQWIYTPDGKAPKASTPKINKLKYNGTGKFTLTGKQLDGVSAGASYGDDNEMDENYPIVALTATDGSGNVYYARTTNWSKVSVADTTTQTVNFTLKSGTPAGNYSMVVSGAGVQSAPSCITITANEAAGTGAAAGVPLSVCQ